MALQRWWSFSRFFSIRVLLVTLVVMARSSEGAYSYHRPSHSNSYHQRSHSNSYHKPRHNNHKSTPMSQWTYAHATFYGDDTASATMGGACGYGNLFDNGYGIDTAALSTVLFNNGYACGRCFQIKCVESPWCNQGATTITVTATNLCPPNWYKPSDAGGWCNPPRQHFDLSKPAFEKLAFWRAGIIPVVYRRVPCERKGGVRFQFQGNPYWLLVYVMNVGGAGDIGQMWVKGSRTGWMGMSHNWGASYQAFAQLGGQSLSFRIKSLSSGETITAFNVAPPYWSAGMTYQSGVNFQP